MTTATFLDCERPMRDLIRADFDDIAERAYLGIPTGATFPLIDIVLLDGGVQPGETPLAAPSFSFSVWGDGPNADRAALQGLAWSFVAWLQALRYAVSGSVALMGAAISTGPVARYDADGTPRYVIDAAVAMKAIA